MPYPHIRKAESRDYETIWSIWMQDHIIQWMSFPKQTQSDFEAHYARMDKASDIYVLVDKINAEEKVVGVRRIKFGKGAYQHIAEYCSLGIHKDFLGKGYGKLFYQEFEKIVKEKGIKRIQLTQSGGNNAAFHLADKDFSEEALFPDWLPRTDNSGSYHLIERYIYKFIDSELAILASTLTSLKYQEIFPELQATTFLLVEREENQFSCFFEGKPLLTVNFEPDDSVIQHIGFLSIKLHIKQGNRI